jgi:hypothetical protein
LIWIPGVSPVKVPVIIPKNKGIRKFNILIKNQRCY